ncbi:MAG TPA: hypothetical protein ENN60_04205, partial [archaeon]|nr:hypothetical protein [archaeon]
PKDVEILWKYLPNPGVGREEFHGIFLSRYRQLSQMLWKRPQLKSAISITNLKRVRDQKEVAVIGMVQTISPFKDGRKMLELEDPTGSINVLIPHAIPGADELVEDEVIGIVGGPGRDIIFANELIFPEVPTNNEWPSPQTNSKVAFIADIHAGSKKFNSETWDNFVLWVNGRPDIKYVLIGGDLVDGIGLYKGQEEELEVDTVEAEFDYLASLISQINRDKQLIIIPGNHDPTNDSEPRQPIPREFAKPLYQQSNVRLLSDPSMVSLEGVSILLYHGTSMDGVIASIDSIRSTAYDQPYQVQRQLLKKRHLSPIFGKNRLLPGNEDHLTIKTIPHVFFTGHIHTVGMSNYRGIRLISAGSFQERTEFQKKLGHHPTPGKFVEMDLATGTCQLIDFSGPVSPL